MKTDYGQKDYQWIKELMDYPRFLEKQLSFFDDTSQIEIPEDPIERVIFQDKAKAAIRKIAQNRGHILMVGRPGTGKSMLADMFNEVLEESLGDYLRPKNAIVAYPGKDKNHIRLAYETPEKIDEIISKVNQDIEVAKSNVDEFSLSEQIHSIQKLRRVLLLCAAVSAVGGVLFPPAFIATGLTGIGAIFMYMQENNHKAQEKIQREAHDKQNAVKHLFDMVPTVLYDPRKDRGLMSRISEPDSRNMKGGFRHDPYQSGNLHTPPHKRAFLGAHAKSPIIYIDELKTLVKAGYMPDFLEIMQNREYLLEGGRNSGSGSADRSEDPIKADNIIVACCNHDTLEYLQKEGDGAFLSRIEDKGEIIQMDSSVPETPETIKQVAQYIKQEVHALKREFHEAWGEILETEGYEGVRNRSEKIFGKPLPPDYVLKEREFSRLAVLEIVRELRCRSTDGKLSGILRPINGIIKTAEFEAILENSSLVEPRHVRSALKEHVSLEGSLAKELVAHQRDLKKYISSMTDSIGYVVGLAVTQSQSSGQMVGQPLPIHGQISAGSSDKVTAPGKTGDIAKAAAQNVRASIKKILNTIGAPHVGYEMHVEYIQAHGGVEGDSASVAMDIALVSDYIGQPVNQKYGVTGSLTGDIILAVGGVTEKIRSIMGPDLGMEGACVPWQNKHDIEPLLINTASEYIQKDEIPGIRIYRSLEKEAPFDIYFCKTKYNAYKILMGLDRMEVEKRMAERSRSDLAFYQKSGCAPLMAECTG
ncbi:MAG: ATP-binding protein [Deltaproteobacteria bacterium]|nr:ATP-binding protein [Deltaproteobacteria bacterium]